MPIENNAFQDHATIATPTTIENSTFQDHVLEVTPQHIGNNALQDPTSKYVKNKSFQDHKYSVKDVQDVISLKNAFPQSFDTTHNMPGVYTICLDPSVCPVQHARCKVPIECRDAIEKLLQEMVDQGIITPVTELTEWVSSLTYPQKPDGSLHICLDPKDLNKGIIWEHYKAPTLDEITHKLNGAKVFSKLDAKDGFLSIHLDTPSSYLTTFSTHKGCCWCLCMPFGLKMSQDVFQMQINQITNRLPGIIAIYDDICMYGKDMAEHNHNLLQLMKMAQGQGLVFNSSKCAICQSKISFYGAIFTAQGMRPDPAKVQALQDLPAPQNPKELQWFLGLIRYLQPFLPSLASKTTFLREQVTNWDWNPSTDQAFNCLKSWVCNMLLKTSLAYYDHTKPLVLQTDASEYGLSTALIQNNRPIAFTSKTLTDVETRYANIERECLSVCFGLKKFHTYIYRRHILVQNDHKPLEMIQRKPIHAALPRLQYMFLKLQKYNNTIQYIPGKDMVLADRLSHFPSHSNNNQIVLHHNIQTINFNSECLKIIRGATERDPIHSTLYRLTLNGWHDTIRTVPCIACHFRGNQNLLSIEDGVLIRGNRVCIPPELQDRTLYDLHDGHLGVEKMTHLARSTIYWQGIDSDIVDYVRYCTTCAKHKALHTVQPMLPCNIPDGPWQEIAAD